MDSLYAVEELHEQFGLEMFPDVTCLSGKNAQRRVCRKQHHAELLGIQVGQVLAMPPENPYPCLTILKPRREGKEGRLQWTYRFETGCWQADIFLDVDPFERSAIPEAEPIYDYLDGLSAVKERILGSMEATPPWPQEHETLNKTLDAVIDSYRRDRNGSGSDRAGLHQRYG